MNNENYKNTLSLLTNNLGRFKEEQRDVFVTSSFQTQSLPLLHIISENFRDDIKVIFLDTGFLFAETYEYLDRLKELFNLNVVTLSSKISKHQQIDQQTGLFQYSIDPDMCCRINKVAPLENFWKPGDVWISGVRRDQSAVRKQMNIIEERETNIIKFHPMLEWSNREVYEYILANNLPKHPLENEGYLSIGCIPCTHKYVSNDPRGGRWLGRQKTECGLHTNNG